jgi:hypothetical protein
MAKLIKLTEWKSGSRIYVNPDNVISVYYAGKVSSGPHVDKPCTILVSVADEGIWVREDVEDVVALIHADA